MDARRGEDYGVETLVINDESREDMEQYVCQLVEDKWIAFRARRAARREIEKWTEISEGHAARTRRSLWDQDS
jgi:hypothetical protein